MKRLTALALFATFSFFAETPARAQGTVRGFQIISAGPDSSIGLGRGQTLRYTWVNIAAEDLIRPDIEVLAVHVRVFSSSDRLVSQAGAPAVGPGKSQFFDFNREEMSVPGEPGTGRLQLRLEVSVEYASSLKIDQFEIRQRLLESFDDGVEVIDSLTGRSTVSFKPKEIVVVGSKPLPTAGAGGQDSIWIDLGTPVGLALQQTLRITAFNPLPPAPAGEDARKFKMLVAPLIVDLDGQVIARGEAIALDPGQSHSFDFRRADLPSSGEPGTGRLQVRSVIQRRFYNGLVSRFSAGGMDRFPGALELVDEGPGTTAMLLPAIQAAREKAGR